MIFHIVEQQSWNEQIKSTTYIHPSLDLEGFIHCSYQKPNNGKASHEHYDLAKDVGETNDLSLNHPKTVE